MLSFESPVYLLFFILLPLLIYQVHFNPHRGGKLQLSFTVWNKKGFFRRFYPIQVFYVVSSWLLWLGISCLVIALAGPVKIEKQKAFIGHGIDIMVVLDESPSMLVQDFKPLHRFGTAQAVIHQFIKGRENDQIGLVTFSNEATLRVPTTIDYEVLSATLKSLKITNLNDGTAIGMGLALACYYLKNSLAEEKVIILLTDGINNAGEVEPLAAAQLASEIGVRIYTIGIGKKGSFFTELTDPATGKNIRGQFKGEVDENLLKNIAQLTNGKYFNASSTGTLEAIFEQIDSVEKIEKRTRYLVNKTLLYKQFIIWGLLLVLCDYIFRKILLKEIL
jgi:Ca-activated chloride channel family protein